MKGLIFGILRYLNIFFLRFGDWMLQKIEKII